MQTQRRTLTGHGVAVLVVLAILNGTAWFVGAPRPGRILRWLCPRNARDVNPGSPLCIQTQLHLGRITGERF